MGRFSSLNKNSIVAIETYAEKNLPQDIEIIHRPRYDRTYNVEAFNENMLTFNNMVNYLEEVLTDVYTLECYNFLCKGDNNLDIQNRIVDGVKKIFNRHPYMNTTGISIESYNVVSISLEDWIESVKQFIADMWEKVCNMFKKTEEKIVDRAHDEEKKRSLEDIVNYIKNNKDRLTEKTYDAVLKEGGSEITISDFNNKWEELREATSKNMTSLIEVVKTIDNFKDEWKGGTVSSSSNTGGVSAGLNQENGPLALLKKLGEINDKRDDITAKTNELKGVGKVKISYGDAMTSCNLLTDTNDKWLGEFDTFTKDLGNRLNDLKGKLQEIAEETKNIKAAEAEKKANEEKSKYVVYNTGSSNSNSDSSSSSNDSNNNNSDNSNSSSENNGNGAGKSSNESFSLEDDSSGDNSSDNNEEKQEDTRDTSTGDADLDKARAEMREDRDKIRNESKGVTSKERAFNLGQNIVLHLTKSMQTILRDNNFYLEIKDLLVKVLDRWVDAAKKDVGDVDQEKKDAENKRNNEIAKAEDDILKNKDKIKDNLDWLNGNKGSIKKTLEIKIGDGEKKSLSDAFNNFDKALNAPMEKIFNNVEEGIQKVIEGSLTTEQVEKSINEFGEAINKAVEEAKKVGTLTITPDEAIKFANEALKYATGETKKRMDDISKKYDETMKKFKDEEEVKKDKDGKEIEDTRTDEEKEHTSNAIRRLTPIKDLMNKFTDKLNDRRKTLAVFYDAFNTYISKVQNGEGEENKTETVDKSSENNNNTKPSNESFVEKPIVYDAPKSIYNNYSLRGFILGDRY